MVGLFANIGQSFGYAFRNTVIRPFFWIGLLLVAFFGLFCTAFGISGLLGGLQIVGATETTSIIMLVIGILLLIIGILLGFFFNGIAVQIFANKKLTFKGFFGTIGRGIQLFIINFIYSLIFTIVFVICLAVGVFGTQANNIQTIISQIQSGATSDLISSITPSFFNNGVTTVGIIMLIVLILLGIVTIIFTLAADVNFARAGKFGAAFHFGEVCKRIGFLGILKFIVAIIFYIIISIIIGIIAILICTLIAMIPIQVLAAILAAIFVFLLIPFLMVFSIKYFGNLFADKAE